MLALPLSVISVKIHIAEKAVDLHAWVIVGAWGPNSVSVSIHQVGLESINNDRHLLATWIIALCGKLVILISLGGRSPRAKSVFGHPAQRSNRLSHGGGAWRMRAHCVGTVGQSAPQHLFSLYRVLAVGGVKGNFSPRGCPCHTKACSRWSSLETLRSLLGSGGLC